MSRNILISEKFKLAAITERKKVIEFFFQNNKPFHLGDIYLARIENVLPSIDAVFVSMYKEKMGFLHASDIPGSGPLEKKIWPKQKVMVQVTKEPTGNKGPRVTTKISLPGRFFVLTTDPEQDVSVSRRINSPQEVWRLKSIADLLKPKGFGLTIKEEASGATVEQLQADFISLFLDKWKRIIDQFEQDRPKLLFREDPFERLLRDSLADGVSKVIVDSSSLLSKIERYLKSGTTKKTPKIEFQATENLFLENGLLEEIKAGLLPRVELPSGGYIDIQQTEAMTVVDVNSGRFTNSNNPAETVLRTNLEASIELARQLRLRNIGGIIVVDFIDMEKQSDRLELLRTLEESFERDPTKTQIERPSNLGIVQLTRHRRENSLEETLGEICPNCSGSGLVFPLLTEIMQTCGSSSEEKETETETKTEIEKEERVINSQVQKSRRAENSQRREEREEEKEREREKEEREREESKEKIINFQLEKEETKNKIRQEKNLPGVYNIDLKE